MLLKEWSSNGVSHVSHHFLLSFSGAFDAVLRHQDWDFEVDLEQKKEDTAFRQTRMAATAHGPINVETQNFYGVL